MKYYKRQVFNSEIFVSINLQSLGINKTGLIWNVVINYTSCACYQFNNCNDLNATLCIMSTIPGIQKIYRKNVLIWRIKRGIHQRELGVQRWGIERSFENYRRVVGSSEELQELPKNYRGTVGKLRDNFKGITRIG